MRQRKRFVFPSTVMLKRFRWYVGQGMNRLDAYHLVVTEAEELGII